MNLKDNTQVQWVSIDKLALNPNNTNKHPKVQIERLAKLIDYQGWRYPIIVRKSNNMIAAGEGRYLSAMKLKLKEVPVSYQEFEDEAQFQAFVTSDNAISEWAELDLSKLKDVMIEMPKKFDIDLMGLKKIEIDFKDKESSKRKNSLNAEQLKDIQRAWADWCLEINESLGLLSAQSIFSQSYNRSFLRIKFLRALYLGESIPRSATLGYQYHRMFCSGDGKNGSISDLLKKAAQNPKLTDRLMFALQDKPSIEKLMTVSGIAMAGHKAPLDFPAELARDVINEFASGGNVLDPCHGWGGRLLGFLLSKAKHYHANDVSPETNLGVSEMADDLIEYTRGKSVHTTCKPFEDLELEKNKFNLVFTSPPYFDRETYIGGDQAHSRYKDYEAFCAGFLGTLIEKSAKALRNSGHLVLQVGNQKYDLDKQCEKFAKAAGLKLKEKRATSMSKLGATEEDEIKEVLLIFSKS